MTLPSDGKKLSDQEAESIELAVKEAGLTAVHPERMEALADRLVQRLKGITIPEKGWRNLNPLDD